MPQKDHELKLWVERQRMAAERLEKEMIAKLRRQTPQSTFKQFLALVGFHQQTGGKKDPSGSDSEAAHEHRRMARIFEKLREHESKSA